MFEIDLAKFKNMISRDQGIQVIQQLPSLMKALNMKII